MFNLSIPTRLVVASGMIICAVLLASAYPGTAQASPLLGTAQSFAVLGGSTVTNTGPTIVDADLGVSPGSAITGFPPGIVTGDGATHITDAVASQAQSDVTTAYNSFAGLACDVDLTGQDLGGLTLTPGVYCFSSSAQLTGELTLDAQGDPAAMFVFQIGSTLTTASNSSVLMIGGSACNVFWQVGSSATLGTTTGFQGNILALTSITLDTGATMVGRALARNGAVTMDSNLVSAAGCVSSTEDPTPTAEIPTATPESATATSEPATPTPETTAPVTSTRMPVSPVVPAVPTATIPGPGGPEQESPAPGSPTPLTPTPIPTAPIPETPVTVVPIPETSTPVVQTPSAPTSTPIAPVESTSTPVVPIPGTLTPETPVGSAKAGQMTATPTTPATQPPSSWPTSTPASTETDVAEVTFPKTGSGGLLAIQQDQSVAFTSLAISIAIVVLLTGGLGLAVEKRRRHQRQ